MCYGYSSFFERARAKELRRAQEKIDALSKERASETPAAQPKAPAKPAEEHEKVPA